MKDPQLIKRICNPLELGFWNLKAEINKESPVLRELFRGIKGKSFEELSSAIVLRILEENLKDIEKIEKKLEDVGMGRDIPWKEIFSPKEEYRKIVKELDISNFIKNPNYLETFAFVGTDKFNDDLFFYSPIEKESFQINLPNSYSKEISATSYYKKPLEIIKHLLKDICPEIKIQISKEYFDENCVFCNYPYLLFDLDLSKISDNYDVTENIERALEEFCNGKFDNSSSFCGIAMENLLSEIYLTLIREFPPRDGLQHLLNKLNQKVSSIIYTKKFKRQIEIKEKLRQDEDQGLIHVIPLLIEEIENIISEKIEEIKITNNRIFPENLEEAISKTISNRNKASHTSFDEAGIFEASLSLRGILFLLIWWNYVKRGVSNWNKDKRTIINEIKKESINFLKEDRFEGITK